MAERRTGFALFCQQFGALLKKNFLLSWRHKRTMSLQLMSSFFFIFLIFCVDEAINARYTSTTTYRNLYDPKAEVVRGIPACEDGVGINPPCYDFLWSGNSSRALVAIVKNIMANNPGRPIPSAKVKGFASPAAVDKWLEANPMRCPGALHFMERTSTVISYGIQINSTSKLKHGIYEDTLFKFQIPFHLAAEREIARYLVGDSSLSWTIALKEFAHPAIGRFSAVGTIGPTFLLAAAMFGFVIQVSSVVAEKELRLRQAMSMMGLYDSVYWFTWLIWEGLLTLVSTIFLILFGMLFRFNFFLKNDFKVLFLMFFLFQFNMIGFAFMISSFISKSSSATTVGFSVFIVGFLTQLVTTFGFPYSDAFAKGYQIVWSLFPPNLLAKGLSLLGDATATKQDEGISWSNMSRCPATASDCLLTMEDIFKWLTSTFFLWFLLAIYFDNIVPDVNGVRKPLFYFLQPSYWTQKDHSQVEGGSLCNCVASIPELNQGIPDDEDVMAEETLVKHQAAHNIIDSRVAVQIRGLVKTFPGTTKIVSCCKCKNSAPYHAVKGLWLNLEKDKLFCLLGHNGAGKTSTINCLTGVMPITAGDAVIYGHSIRSARGRSNIQNFMGVCPQFDTLWDALSSYEHLSLFGSIKGIPPAVIKDEAETLLLQVKLSHVANVRAGSYSGGMKRRLSVAIALIGNPKLIFLDEPTSGMDPITRRHVWDIIESAKSGRAIVLTTHSMEEADILSDRIAIMARGKLRCIGTSIHLKSCFGTGYIVNVCLHKASPGSSLGTEDNGLHSGPVKRFFKDLLNVEPKEENKSYITFVIPRDKEEKLKDFFAELQDKTEELGISDIQLSLTTLEEVFLSISKQAELETAAAEGRLATLNLASGRSVQVPIGAPFIKIPGTETTDHPNGFMVEVHWQHDDTGSLCISGHSDLRPVAEPLVQGSTNM
uniref:ABC transporter domain-containing protein n=1 Tax=Araucaria cunninghamii TaxID=56994 RepID=A0A0D6R137_ARACU